MFSYPWSTTIKRYHGLRNQGATCYLNSILQVLFMTKEFREAVESNPDRAGADYHLRMLFDTLMTQDGHTNDITWELGITDVWKQRDAAVYFEKILNVVHPDVSKFFKWQQRHVSTCSNGHQTRNEVCSFWTLPLSLKDSSAQPYKVIDGFRAFFKTSAFNGDNMMYCGDCAANTKAVSTLVHPPLILTLVLKRFEFDFQGWSYVKIVVEIPHILKTESCQYELYAIVDQKPGLRWGHYTAKIKSYDDQKWYEFDDRHVKQWTSKENDSVIRSSSAYLLMYKKCASEGQTTSAHTQQNTGQEARRKTKETSAVHPASPGHSEPTATNTYAKSVLKSGASFKDTKAEQQHSDEGTKDSTGMLSTNHAIAQSETRSGESERGGEDHSHRASRRAQESHGVSGCLQQESVSPVCGPPAQQNIDQKGKKKSTSDTSASPAKFPVHHESTATSPYKPHSSYSYSSYSYDTHSYDDPIRNSSSRQPVYECGYHGLQNQGATCYLNSILQVLFMTKEFREAVESNPFTVSANYYLQTLFDTLKKQMGHTNDITCLLGIKDVWKQRDAAEYFEKILNVVHPDVSKIFNGRLRHSSTCQQGHVTSDEVCPFWTLALSMEDSSGQPYRVIDGFHAFFKDSALSGDNKMYCGDCAEKTEAATVCTLVNPPLILTLLLKRFEFDYRSMSYVKINRDVEIPHTLQTESSQYKLYAIVDQKGSLNGGHYTARIKSFDDQKWYEFDDHHVRQSKENDSIIRSSSAYLLMYKKCVSEGQTPSAHTQQNTGQEARRKTSKETSAVHPASPGHSEQKSKSAKSILKSGASFKDTKAEQQHNDEGTKDSTDMLSTNHASAQSETRGGESERGGEDHSHRASRRSQESRGVSGCLHFEPSATNTYAKSDLSASCTLRENRHTYNSEANQGSTGMLSASYTSAQLGPKEGGCQHEDASTGFPYQGTPV